MPAFFVAGWFGVGWSQNLIPNADLARDANGPGYWTVGEGDPTRGAWETTAGGRGLGITGGGEDAGSWHTTPLPLEAGRIYRLHFRGRRDATASGGTAVAGTSRVNRDFPLTPENRDESFAFLHPHEAGLDYVRLGQWHVRGTLHFEQALLLPAVAVHERSDDGVLELGEAESVRGGVYRFEPDLGWEGANAHRTLVTNRAGFNSNRWLFQPGAEVVYRLGAGRAMQTRASIRVGINHHVGGALAVEAAREARGDWVELGRFDGQRRGGVVEVPAAWFPTETVLVRLRQAETGAGFQVDALAYEARLAGSVPDFEGGTRFVEIHGSNPRLGLEVERFGGAASAGGVTAWIRLDNRSGESRRVRMAITRESAPSGGVPGPRLELRLPPGRSERIEVPGPSRFGAGDHRLKVWVTADDGSLLALAATTFRSGILDDSEFGTALVVTNGLSVWWCDSMRKVGRRRPVPAVAVGAGGDEGSGVRVELARGESEAAQVVLHPERETTLLGVAVGAFRDGQGRAIAGLEARVEEVGYVHVTRPTDASAVRGWYPDPLPPLRTPLPLNTGENQPLWVTVRAGSEAPAGLARAELRLRTDRVDVRVPVEVTIFDFELPRETHLRSAFGLGSGIIDRYHRLTRREDREAVFEKYLRNFAEHRISPYSFYDHAPIEVRFVTEEGGTGKVARVDFTAFDAAAERWLGEGGFNTFQLPLKGMGGGTFHSRHLGSLEGFEEGTPEHTRLFRDYLGRIERHLGERGWLSKAFTYWFDEPDPKDYEFVVAGMKRLKEAAPGIRRMLTEQPEPALMGHVDIWCGLTPEWTPETVRARRAAGEEVWWYICTAPKAPYVTEFIDHPGTELRLWPWQSWQYGVNGLLVWATLYWTSPLVYPEPARQDPWQDPMSWVTGYGYPVGHQAPWGNGDGRFLYPPRSASPSGAEAGPILEGPVNSIRWENLRDGMEDYEYLWLLQREVERVSGLPGRGDEGRLDEARGLLIVPEAVSRDLTRFTTVPEPIQRQRRAIAEAIVRLRQVR